MTEPITPQTVDAALQKELGELIVSSLGLEVSVTEIDPEAPLYGDGLGLDSIDILEIALVLSKKYGLQLKADNADNTHIFKSLNTLTAHIAANRTK